MPRCGWATVRPLQNRRWERQGIMDELDGAPSLADALSELAKALALAAVLVVIGVGINLVMPGRGLVAALVFAVFFLWPFRSWFVRVEKDVVLAVRAARRERARRLLARVSGFEEQLATADRLEAAGDLVASAIALDRACTLRATDLSLAERLAAMRRRVDLAHVA